MLRKRPILVLFATILILSGIAVILWTSKSNTAPSFLKNAQPNGYREVVRASKLLQSADHPSSETNAAELAAIIATNRPALEALRDALKLPIEAPAEAYKAETALDYLTAAAVKRLAQILKYEGRLAEAQGRYSDAAAVYLELMRFGQKWQAGPLLSFLNGASIENLGQLSLERLEPKLAGPDRARIAAELEKLNNSRLPFDEIIRRERHYIRRNTPSPLHYAFAVYKSRPVIARTRSKYDLLRNTTTALIENFKKNPVTQTMHSPKKTQK